MRGRSTWNRPKPKAEFVPWKVDVCEVEGCDERHPGFSRDGMAGPWRCQEHDRTATKQPDPAGGPMPKQPSRLL